MEQKMGLQKCGNQKKFYLRLEKLSITDLGKKSHLGRKFWTVNNLYFFVIFKTVERFEECNFDTKSRNTFEKFRFEGRGVIIIGWLGGKFRKFCK